MFSKVIKLPSITGFVLALIVGALATARGADVADAQKLFNSGRYSDCITACATGIASNQWEAKWWLLKIRAEMATGQYAQAMTTYRSALARHDDNIAIRLLGYDVFRFNNRPQDANALLVTIRTLVTRNPQQYASPADRVVVGRMLAIAGAESRQVLELFFDNAKKANPNDPAAYIATGQLALEKQDFALAAESFQAASKLAGGADDPDIQYGLAKAYEDDSERTTAALTKAMELNPHHVDSLLMQIDNLIDQEQYADAASTIKEVLDVNPRQPRAWAYRAVLAHLAGDKNQEQSARTEALKPWSSNPEVDNLIGQKLSQKYRFAEGEAYQRQSLKFNPNYQPAKLQLCQDLLRLGKEEEGWALASDVFKDDQYSVVAYNLVTLHDNISKFKSLKNGDFLVRMDDREATIYGQRVQELLARAKETLGKKYDVQLPQSITVEVFPQQKDFAIRTFGMPGGAGYLGVCFGPVITVNSPASRPGTPANWEAVLWHEFCHVITLSKTHNKMPRWLSEGISVYEERQQNPAWGQTMNPQYRDMVLSGKITPVSKLSGAFLKPPTPMHLQLAYYESSMVVDYVVSHYGADSLKKILIDLGNDVPINQALAKYTEPIDKLDTDFAKWLKTQAEQLAPKADLERPDLPLDADSVAMAAWNKDHPDNFWGLIGEGRALLAESKWEAAKAPLNKAIALYPNYAAPGGPYLLLASSFRQLGDTNTEKQMLQKHVSLSADAIEPRIRLMEIAVAETDWSAVRLYAQQVLAINPLIPAPHRFLAQAAENLGDRALAIESQRILLLMDPLDRADHHYQLARLLVDDQKLGEARREVVLALERAPRFLAAHRLLLQIVDKMGNSPTTVPTTQP